jgi:Prophage tail length tape measure protein
MTDLATLGLAVDSKQVTTATDALGKLTAASKGAETATKGFETGAQKASNTARALAESVKKYDLILNAKMGANSPQRDSRGEDIKAYGDALDDLKAKFSPLYAAERQYQKVVGEITQAHKVGALSQTEMAVAIGYAENAYKTQARVIEHSNKVLVTNTHNANLSSYAMTNLAFQINDVATMAALGADPLRILASQGGQFYQVLSQGEGGVRGSLGYLGGLLRGMITPFRLLTGAALGFAGTAVMASTSWASAQRDIQNGLLGMGSAAGVTAGDINRIADAAASTGKLTVGAARDMAIGFASTGRIGAAMAEDLVKVSRSVAKAYGETTEEAGQRLAKAFADPKNGVDELNKRFMAFDASTRATIKSLADQGRWGEAQIIMFGGLAKATAGAAAQTTVLERAWDDLAAKGSELWTLLGKNPGGALFGKTLEDQYKDAKRSLDNLRNAYITPSPERLADAESRVAAVTAEIIRLGVANDETAAKLASSDLSSAIKAALPNVGAVQAATDAYEKLNLAMRNPDAVARLPEYERNNAEFALQALRDSVTAAQTKAKYQQSSLDIAKEDANFALQAINARTTAQQAEIAYAQTLSRLRREGDPNAELKALTEKNRVIAEGNVRILNEVRQRNFAAAQGLASSRLELELLGKSVDEAARLRAEYEAVAAVKAQAFAGNRDASDLEIRRAKEDALKKSAIESDIRRAQLKLDLDFERQQIGRSQSEQNVYSRLQGLGLLTNGQIEGAQANMVAGQIRLNEQLALTNSLQRDFATNLVKDLVAGKSATEALSNALSQLASKLLDLSLDQGLSALFGGSNGGGLASLFSGGGGDVGLGTWAASVLHDGGIAGNDNPSRSVSPGLFVNAPRYHNGGIAGLKPDEVPAILQRGEQVIPNGAQVASGDVNVTINNSISATGLSQDTVKDLNDKLQSLAGSIREQVLQGVTEARERRLA